MDSLTWLWIVLGVVGAIAVIVAIWCVWAYNKLVRLRNDIQEAASTIKVYQKKRFNLIPNLVETVKGYAAHETDVLERVTRMRAEVERAATPQQERQAQEGLSRAVGSLFAVAEGYPDLKASANFLDLQAQLGSIENEIAMARKYYNANVKLYNTMIEQWPARYIAERHTFTREDLYDVDDDAQLANVQVHFEGTR